MKKFLLHITTVLVVLMSAAFWFIYFSPRPPLTIDPETLAGDGSTINYCELPILDGSGKMAVDIAKGNTPGCGYTQFPLPILRERTEPLPEEASDIRGLWIGFANYPKTIRLQCREVAGSHSSSRISTFSPACARIEPRELPPIPPPMMATSTFSSMVVLLSVLFPRDFRTIFFLSRKNKTNILTIGQAHSMHVCLNPTYQFGLKSARNIKKTFRSFDQKLTST